MKAERKLLAALCQGVVDPPMRAAILMRLSSHVFAETDHHVIYRALAATPATDPAEMPHALARAVTRLGFPDMDIDSFWKEPAPVPDEIVALLAHL